HLIISKSILIIFKSPIIKSLILLERNHHILSNHQGIHRSIIQGRYPEYQLGIQMKEIIRIILILIKNPLIPNLKDPIINNQTMSPVLSNLIISRSHIPPNHPGNHLIIQERYPEYHPRNIIDKSPPLLSHLIIQGRYLEE